jgi:hypothetical protein
MSHILVHAPKGHSVDKITLYDLMHALKGETLHMGLCLYHI